MDTYFDITELGDSCGVELSTFGSVVVEKSRRKAEKGILVEFSQEFAKAAYMVGYLEARGFLW